MIEFCLNVVRGMLGVLFVGATLGYRRKRFCRPITRFPSPGGRLCCGGGTGKSSQTGREAGWTGWRRQTPFWSVGYQGSPGIGLRLGDHRDHIKWTHTLAVSTSRAVLDIVQLRMLASHAIWIFGNEPQHMRWASGNATTASGTAWRVNVGE